MPVFVFLVILGGFLLWALLCGVWKSFGWHIKQWLNDMQDAVKSDSIDKEEQDERE